MVKNKFTRVIKIIGFLTISFLVMVLVLKSVEVNNDYKKQTSDVEAEEDMTEVEPGEVIKDVNSVIKQSEADIEFTRSNIEKESMHFECIEVLERYEEETLNFSKANGDL